MCSLTLEVGAITENVNVTGRGADPRHDVGLLRTELRSRAHRGSADGGEPADPARQIRAGHHRPDDAAARASGQIDGPNDGAGTPVGGVGSFNYTIDGATNAGNNRRMAASPNSDMIQEMRVETSNFDASQGHGTGANISLMTRAGTNLRAAR